jgi:positive regulator of sigma E activity
MKNFGYYVLFFFILNLVVNSISGGEPNFIASIIYFILLGFWLLAIKLQKLSKEEEIESEKSEAKKNHE